MTTQLFKNDIPNSLLFLLFDKICEKKDNCYIFNKCSYKKGVINNLIEQFIQDCIPYYYISKRNYLYKKMTYNNFITIIRQICNYNNITYTSNIKYDKSKYEIIYFIYF